MSDTNYMLFIFNESIKDEFLKEPKEVKVLKEVATGSIKGASCGPINFCLFPSDRSKEEIADKLVVEKIRFILLDEKDSEHSLPKYIRRMFNDGFGKEPDVREVGDDNDKPKKLSLEDQLAAALKDEDFIMAAALRDKIAKRSQQTEAPGNGGSTLRQLFE